MLIEPVRFDVIVWYVCPPEPQPTGYRLKHSASFVTRPGVTVSSAADGTGCIRIMAVMASDYVPLKPNRHSVAWSWAEIDDGVSKQLGQPMNVRDKIKSLDGFNGNIALYPVINQDPLIDSYSLMWVNSEVPSLQQLQPFPFFGQIEVWWEESWWLRLLPFLSERQ